MAVGPYIIPTSPTSGEGSSYNRHPFLYFWLKNAGITWKWALVGTYERPRARFCIGRKLADGSIEAVPVSAWVDPPATGTVSWLFTFDLPDGHYLAMVETDPPSYARLMAKPFLVNASGARLPDEMQKPWVAVNRFELTFGENAQGDNIGQMSNGWDQVEWRPDLPAQYHAPLKAREIIDNAGAFVPKSQRWVRRIQTNLGAGYVRKFRSSPPYGDIVVEGYQPYFYDDTTSTAGYQIGLRPPILELTDGPYGKATDGMAYKAIGRRGRRGWYMFDPSGRVYFKSRNGTLKTLVGWRTKEGELRVHGGVKNVNYMRVGSQRAADLAMYDAAHEHLGDWSQVPGVKFFHELWGGAVAQRKPELIGPDNPEGIDDHDGHELWVCDTLNHRILFADHWTAHPADHFEPAHFPPPGYIQASAPTGQTTVAKFIGNDDSTPSAYVNEPWDDGIRKQDGRLYWSNFGGDSICSAKLDGSDPQVLIESVSHPTDTMLGIPRRLAGSNSTPGHLRSMYSLDGPQGVAKICRPQGFDFDSNGDLIFAERYTFLLKKYTFATGGVTTLAKLTSDTSDADSLDLMVRIDREGSCFWGKDAIVVLAWKGNDSVYAPNGALIEKLTVSGTLRNGPGDLCDTPWYNWAAEPFESEFYVNGSAGALQGLLVSKRLPTDPTIDLALYRRGYDAVRYSTNPPIALTHGTGAFEGAELGKPTTDALKAWGEQRTKDYFASLGMPASELDAAWYFVEWCSVDADVSGYGGGADTTPPSAPHHALDYQIAWS